MGYPGDTWPPSPYGEGAAGTPGHDPYRGYPPLNDPQGPPPAQGDTPYYGDAPAYGGSGQQPPYAGSPTGPYGPPQPYTEPPPYGGFAPSGPQAPAGPGGWQGPPAGYGGPPDNGGGKGRMLLIIGGIVAVVVLLGGGGTALAFAMKKDPPKPQPTPTAAQPTKSPTEAQPTPTRTGTPSSGKRWLKLASRSTDPHAITLSEMFGKAHLTDHHRSYRLVTRQGTRSCDSVITGGKLRAALTAGNCTQVLRATYLRGDGKLMGTVSISNLADYSGVRNAFSAAAGGQQYVDPLRGSGPTARLGRGFARGISQVKGHYLILSWVQYTNGHRPSTAGRKQLTAFHDDVVSAALVRPLGYRMLTGRPQK